MSTLQTVMAEVKTILVASPRLVQEGLVETEAEQLIQAAIQRQEGHRLSRLALYSAPDVSFSEGARELVLKWSRQRAGGEPLQYLTGQGFFLDHEYEVCRGVLIPRPETELLAEYAIQWMQKRHAEPGLGVEVGVGTGVLSIECLAVFPRLNMIASDINPLAIDCAARNAERILGAAEQQRLKLLRAVSAEDPLRVLKEFLDSRKADFLISNPPYLAPEDPIDPEVLEHEPGEALFASGSDPLLFYRSIAREAGVLLQPGAPIFLELPPERATAIRQLFEGAGWTRVGIQQDLAGRDRYLSAERRSHG